MLFLLSCIDVVFVFVGSVFVVLLCVESCVILLLVCWIDMCRVLFLVDVCLFVLLAFVVWGVFSMLCNGLMLYCCLLPPVCFIVC